MSSNSNPFANLDQVTRSEEDEIRKGIFRTVLRNLSKCDLNTKREWCKTIYTALNTKRGARNAKIAPASCSNNNNNGNNNSNNNDKTTNEKENSTSACTSQVNSASQSSNTEASSVTETDIGEFTMEEAGEYIALYMRGLLDRVVGTSLNSLAVTALRVLCYMLDINTESHSKEVLYNKLANFYYTHCEKIGKRVSRSTFVEAQAAHDAQMMKSLNQKSNIPLSSSHTSNSASHTITTSNCNNNNNNNDNEKSKHKISRKGVVNYQEKVAQTIKRPRNERNEKETSKENKVHPDSTQIENNNDIGNEHYYSANVDTLDVLYNNPVFKTRNVNSLGTSAYENACASSSVVCSSINKSNDWSQSTLEKNIASIIQIYDPVTVSTIVRKLSQMGYDHANVNQTVESILKSFHQRQLILYDSGIAYMM